MTLHFKINHSPRKMIKHAFLFPINIFEIASECEPQQFLDELCNIAREDKFVVNRIDFSIHKSPAIAVEKNKLLDLLAEEQSNDVFRLFIFENVDALASMQESITFTLRTLITNNIDSQDFFVFTAYHENLLSIFHNSKSAFYQSCYRAYT